MKRIVMLTALLAAVILGMTSLAAAGPSVPNYINFQGRLADNAGNPVADGAYSVRFGIFAVPVGGSQLWGEITTQNTMGGLFTEILGPFPDTLFEGYDSLFLEVTVQGETQSPRTRLTSNPYARVANNLEVKDDNTDTVAIRTVPALHQLSTYGIDGQEQIRLWGATYGEIFLYDADPTNDRTVRLTANNSAGGELELTDDGGNLAINLHGGLTGDASVVVPNNAVNSDEMFDEPGVAGDFALSNFTSIFNDGIVTLAEKSITCPASGYVLAIGATATYFQHNSGDSTSVQFGVSDDSVGFPFGALTRILIGSTLTSAQFRLPVSVHGLFPVNAGTSTFHFLAWHRDGGGFFSVGNNQLTLVYLPTAYGGVSPPSVSRGLLHDAGKSDGEMGAGNIIDRQTQTEKFNAERIARELTQVKAEMEARMQKIEEQLQQNRVEDRQ